MCGRYSLFAPPEDLEARFDAAHVDDYRPRYNAAPGQSLPVVTNDAPDAIQHLQWGLVPSWADDPSDGLINARAETIGEKPSFRAAYERRRCLVLADGFYEWKTPGTDNGNGDRNGSGPKQPYRVTRADGEPFAMAGLWERWEPDGTQTGLADFGGDGRPDVDPDALETFAVVTTEPNDVVADLHDRMAVVLPPDEERRWLAEPTDDILVPYEGKMRAYPVSTAVNDPSNDSPELVEPPER